MKIQWVASCRYFSLSILGVFHTDKLTQSIEVDEENPNNDNSELPSGPLNTVSLITFSPLTQHLTQAKELNISRASLTNFLSSPSPNLILNHESPLYSSEQDEYESREPSPTFSEAPTVVEARWTGLVRDIFILTFGYKIEEDLNDRGDCITTVRELRDGQFPTLLVVIDLNFYFFEDGLWETGRQLLTSRLAEAVDEMKQVLGPERTRREKIKIGGVLSMGEFSQFYHMSDKNDGLQDDLWPLGWKPLLHWDEDERYIRAMLEYWSRQSLFFDA